jgi:hypothetical protein
MKKIIASALLLSAVAGAFQSDAWNDVVRRAIEDRKNNREILGYIKYEPLIIKRTPSNPNAYLMDSAPVDPRKMMAEVSIAGATHGRTEGIRRATMDAFNEVEADSDKNAAKLAVGDKYQKALAQIVTEFETMGDAGIMVELKKYNLTQGKAENYGFQDGQKAGSAVATKSKYVESGSVNGKAEAEKLTDGKLKERANREARDRATREAEANLMKPESLKVQPAFDQNSDADVKSRLFDEPNWEDSPYFKPPKKAGGDNDAVKFVELYKKSFVEAARKAYATVKPVAKQEAARSLTYWYKSKYAKLDHTQIINDLTLQAKLGFLSAYESTRAEKYKKNFENSYNMYALAREKEVYPKMFEETYKGVKDVIMNDLSHNLKPSVDGFVVDENADGVFAPGELAFVVLDINNWGGAATNAGDLVVKIAPSTSNLKTSVASEQVKPVPARSKSQVQKLLPFKITDDAKPGFAANATVEVLYKNETIRTIPVSVEVNLPLEVQSVTISNSEGQRNVIGLGDSFKVRANGISRKMTADRKKYVGKIENATVTVKSLDQGGADSQTVQLKEIGSEGSRPVNFTTPYLESSIKIDKGLGPKKFRLEIADNGKVIGAKEFEVVAVEPLPRVSDKGEYKVLQGTTMVPADVLLISDSADLSQRFKAAAEKSNLKVAVVDTNLTAKVEPYLEKCSQNIPVAMTADAKWLELALAKQCAVLVLKDNQWPLSDRTVVVRSIVANGFDKEFEVKPSPFEPLTVKYINDGLTYNVYDAFVGINFKSSFGRLNFMTVAFTPEGETMDLEKAVREFVLVTQPLGKKVQGIVDAANAGDQATLDLLKASLLNDLLKEIKDNKKYDLDEYEPTRNMKHTRLYRFVNFYKALPEGSRAMFYSMAEPLKDSAGSFFSFSSRRSHILDVIKPLTSDAAMAGF